LYRDIDVLLSRGKFRFDTRPSQLCRYRFSQDAFCIHISDLWSVGRYGLRHPPDGSARECCDEKASGEMTKGRGEHVSITRGCAKQWWPIGPRRNTKCNFNEWKPRPTRGIERIQSGAMMRRMVCRVATILQHIW